jgi:group II intron reverse transcriptase/maturase
MKMNNIEPLPIEEIKSIKSKFNVKSPSYPETIKGKRESILMFGTKLNSFSARNLNNIFHINHQVYHLLLDPFTLDNAYKNLSKNKGAFTNGVNVGNIQGYSRNKTMDLIELLKKKEYYPDPVRRIWIPKPGKSTKRPLGIPSFADKVIQEAMRGILEAVYEPEFTNFSNRTKLCENFGFRPNKSCWDAIEHFTKYGQKTTFVIEGDIKGAYDNVNHKILINIISKRIKDKNFIDLLQRFLDAGIMDEGKYEHSLLGVPQGGVLSPLLFNIYMFEFDKYIYDEIISKHQSWITNKNKSKLYQNTLYQKNKILKQFRNIRDEFLLDPSNIDKKLNYKNARKALILMSNQLLKTPSYNLPTSNTFVYTRYADDWILGIGGTLEFTNQIKSEIEEWLSNTLKLTLSPEKTKITHIKKEFVPFLGYEIKLQTNQNRVKIITLSINKKPVKRRTTSQKFFTRPNAKKLYNNVINLGFATSKDLYPIGKRPWASLNEYQIVQKYHSIFLGLCGHYMHCSTQFPLNRLSYIFQFSCAKTIATRRKITTPQVFSKYGKQLIVNAPYLDDSENSRTIEFMGFTKIKNTYFNNIDKTKALTPNYDPFKIRTFWRTTFKLYSQCCICGCDNNIEMHHINSLKNIKVGSKNESSFNTILKQLNRKQIPVCKECHSSITHGEYSGLKLTDLFNESLAAL